jgi:hypothetical protein
MSKSIHNTSEKDVGHIHRKTSMKRAVDKSHDEQQSIPLKRKIVMRPHFQKQKIAFEGQNQKKAETKLSIKLKPAGQKQKAESKLIPKAAAAFNSDSDSEPEEMPLEARMRMKNIGRNTPTSAGPNSFNKGRLGFSDNKRGWELQQKKLLTSVASDKKEK